MDTSLLPLPPEGLAPECSHDGATRATARLAFVGGHLHQWHAFNDGTGAVGSGCPRWPRLNRRRMRDE